MANEITITARLRAIKSYLSIDKNQTINADLSATAVADVVQNIGTTYEQIVLPAEVTAGGYAWFRNLDATNYVEIGVEVSAAFYPLVKLKAGEVAVLRLATATIFAKANTAAVNLQSCVLGA